jgi:RNAse (barnase) inhibitor barstar
MKAEFSKLIESGKSGVFRCHTALSDAALNAASHRGMHVAPVALTSARDKNAFLNAVAKVLDFPDYSGHNWDAFYDCLLELEHGKGEGTLLLLREASGFARAEPEEFAAAVDALQDAAEYWEDEKKTLLVVVELDAPVLAPDLPELGASGRSG